MPHTNMQTQTYTCNAHMYIHTHTHTNIYTCTYAHIYMHMYMHMHTCTLTHIQTHMHTHPCLFIHTTTKEQKTERTEPPCCNCSLILLAPLHSENFQKDTRCHRPIPYGLNRAPQSKA